MKFASGFHHFSHQRQVDAVGGAEHGFDKQALVAFQVDGADVIAVDLQVGEAQMGQVADQAEAATEMLQSQPVTRFAHGLAEALQFSRRRQVALVDLQGQQAGMLRVVLK